MRKILLLFCLLAFRPLFSQKAYIFDHLSVEEGLSDNTITCIFQDSRGLLWIGTQDGLNVYNAYEFDVYKNKKNNLASLSDNYIWDICEDKMGKIWVATNKGLNMYDRITQTFTTFSSKNSKLISDKVYAVIVDKQANLWVGTEKGIARYNELNEEFDNYQFQKQGSNAVYAIFQDSNGEVLAGSFGYGLWKYDSEKNTFAPYPNYPHSLNKDYVRVIFEDRNKNLWIGTDHGLRQKSPQSPDFKIYNVDSLDYPLSHALITAINEDHFGNLWVGTAGGGVNVLHKNTHTFSHFRNDFNDLKSIAHDEINHIFTDKSGIIWIATNGGGISFYDFGKYPFRLYTHQTNNKNSLIDNFIWGFCEDQEGKIWIGTKGGLNCYDPKSQQYTLYNTTNSTISDNHVICIIETDDQKLWIGTTNGLNIFDKKTGKFSVYKRTDNIGLTDSHIISLFQDSKGTIWVGTISGGLHYFLENEKKFKAFRHDPLDPNSLSDNMVQTICEDKKGNLWVGTYGGGLNVLDKQRLTFNIYKNNSEQSNSLSHNSVKYLFCDSQGTLWVGTHGGLDKFDAKNGTFQNFNQKNGLPDNNVHAIVEDQFGDLWISTSKGIARFSSISSRFYNYDTYDLLQGKVFNNGSVLFSKNKELFFGGINGYNAFFPQEVKRNPYIPPIQITNFRIEEINEKDPLKRLLIDKKMENNAITLSYHHNTFSFEVAALNFRHPEKNQYQYFLKNHDKTWSLPTNSRHITYTNLPAGTYYFSVKASNNDGIWGQPLTPIKIVINPPFWDTWLFRFLVLFAAILLIYLAYRVRIRQVEKRNKFLEALVKERTQEIESQKDRLANAYQNVKIISEIGQKLTSQLHHDLVINTLFESVNKLMDISIFRIGIYHQEQNRIVFEGFTGNSRLMPYHYDSVDDSEKLSVWCLMNKKEIFITDFDTQFNCYSNRPLDTSIKDRPASIIYIPLVVEEDVIGLLTVQSQQKHAYTEEHRDILRTLAIYVAIAVDNSVTYSKLKDANNLIAAKNEHILGSIRYAERIQQAILPPPETIKEFFPESFVIFKPKDIVSGDFYWFKNIDKQSYIAVIDCTGHGVPGAFMSMIGNTLLNEIVRQYHDPATILEELHIGIRVALKQDNNINDDGMDVVMCLIEPLSRKVMCAAAKRPLWHVHKNGLEELKGDRKSIGGRQKEERRIFINYEFKAAIGDMIYLSSDGFADQNNPNRIKFSSEKLKTMLQNVYTMRAEAQKLQILQTLQKHQQDQAQRDDITLIGIKL